MKRFCRLFVFLIILSGWIPHLAFAQVVNMPDATLAAVVRAELGLAPNTPITRQAMQRLYHLNDYQGSGVEFRIKDLTGLEHATGLNTVFLTHHDISDLGPLEGLPLLSSLYINGNPINDFSPLAGLTRLEILSVSVRSVALMNNLRRHVDLAQLEGLSIDGKGNQIGDLSSFANLTQLKSFGFSYAQIRDVTPIKNLTQLEYLNLSGNQIRDVTPLKNLTQLETLHLSNNQVDITSLAGLTQLETLHLGDNEIRDVTPLKNLAQLEYLNLSNNEIRDITPLKNLTQLKGLFLGHNEIRDITPLKDLTGLMRLPDQWKRYVGDLDLRHNQIRDVTPIQHLIDSASTQVWLEGNPIDAQPEGGADLVVESVKATRVVSTVEKRRGVVATETKRYASPGGLFTLHATVRNQGTEISAKTRLRFYCFTDNLIITGTDGGKKVGEVEVGPLFKQSEVTRTIDIRAPQTADIYYYRACIVDSDEQVTTCSTQSAKITVTQPELKITSIKAGQKGAYRHAMKKSLTVAPGAEFDLLIDIKNEGERVSQGAEVTFYQSTDNKISTTDVEVGTLDLKNEKLAPKSLVPDSRGRVRAPETPGTYYYGACVKSTVPISDTNCSAPVTVVVPGLWKGFISQVAHSGDGYTYFVVNPPHFVNVPGLRLSEFDVKACSVTLHTPASGYFMFPLDTPKGQRIVENLQKVEKSIKFGYSILGVMPKSLIAEEGLLKKLKAGVVGTVLKLVSVIGGVIDTVIDIVNPEDPTALPTLTVTPSDGTWKTLLSLFIDDLFELENYEYDPFLPPMLFVIREPLSSIDITVKQVYNIYDDLPDRGELTYTYRQTWDLKNGTGGGPSLRPMSLADYSRFQQLAPEIQQYLLQHFGEPANSEQLNPRTWQIPEETSLLSNYPNPFNPETWIPYQLAEPSDVSLTIYDIHGRVVRDLDLGHQRAGIYRSRSRAAYWDGRNAQGEPVASGLYFYTLKAGDFTATRKMLIRK